MNRLVVSCEQLATVQRLDELEMEQARVEKSKADAVVEHRSRAVDALGHQLEQTRKQNEAQLTSGIAVGAMRQLAEYVSWQVRAFDECQSQLSKAQDAAEHARANLMRRFERLSAIERLRERRMRELNVERASLEQRALDDYGTLAAAGRISSETNRITRRR